MFLHPTVSFPLHPFFLETVNERGEGDKETEENSSAKGVRGREGGRREKSRRSFNDMPYSSCLACEPYYPLTEGFHKARALFLP